MTIDYISKNERYYQTLEYTRSRARVGTTPDLQEKAIAASGNLIPPQTKDIKISGDNEIQKKDWPKLSSPVVSATVEDIAYHLENILKLMKDDAPDLYSQMMSKTSARGISGFTKNQDSQLNTVLQNEDKASYAWRPRQGKV
ncbi:hypothetical protein APX81_17225 [Escherichia coli]|uniref:hypothetical protein n=1 Tax=Escherichia coli TaxID=562 RepID=UPI00058A2E27|nr:hypothetical protein [Escherichia coli]EAC1403639.1 hypothetical protein [Escherichia coli]EEW6031439.1 hypothetical protein [Escherichia coli]EFC4872276.1 hypothetical protein [Escherichia coli]EFN9260363.1 hypothetical protein [Escherichia coli]EGK3604191.1 hypothetical protein [Escherichia coli]